MLKTADGFREFFYSEEAKIVAMPLGNGAEHLACILKVSKNQGGFDLLSPLDSSRMLGTWEIVS